MNVAHLCTLDHGGAGIAALRLHQSLLEAGVDSTMLVLARQSRTPGVVEVPTRRSPGGPAAWAAQWRRWETLMRRHPGRPEGSELFSTVDSDALLAGHPALARADIVNLHWVAGLLDMNAAAAILAGKTIVWTLHDQNPFTGGCHYAGDCRRFEAACGRCPELGSPDEDDLSAGQWRKKRLAYKDLDITVASPSRWLAGEARRSVLLGAFPAEVIPYGVPRVFSPSAAAAVTRESLGLGASDFLVLFGAHSHTRRKGAHHVAALLRALPARLSGRRVIALSFGGRGGQPESTVPFADLGPIDDPARLAAVYAMADAYVLPTLMDNLPNTVLEALACGTPVVAFEAGGVPDCVRHGENGWLTPVGSVTGLLEGLAHAARGDGDPRSAIAADAARRFAPERQAGDYIRLYERLRPGCLAAPAASPAAFAATNAPAFVVAGKRHWAGFRGLDTALYGAPVDPRACDLKRYQDLLALAFIEANLAPDSRILEVGGGNSRVLAHLAGRHECWNIDRFEGLGSGPTEIGETPYRVVRDYMGAGNPALPEGYFDLVFSISALEHVPQDEGTFRAILADIDRVLRPGGLSFHLFDVVLDAGGTLRTNDFLSYLFARVPTLQRMPDAAALAGDPDLYVMTREGYDACWKGLTGKSYDAFGRPTSINIAWRRP